MNISDIFKGPAPKSLSAVGAVPSSAAGDHPTTNTTLAHSHKRKADSPASATAGTFRPPKLPRTSSSSPTRTSSSDFDPTTPNHDGDNQDPDDDPRFFGDGLSTHDRQVLDLVDTAESAVDLTHLDAAALKKLVARLDKSLALNQELRARYPTEPQRFLASELDLDSDVRALALLATAPRLYPLATRMGVPGKVVGMLAHENPDVAIAAVEVLAEVLDDDVVNPLSDEDDEDDDEGHAGHVIEGIRGFVRSMLTDADFLTLFEAAFRLAHADTEVTSAEEKDEALAKYLSLLDSLLAVEETMAARVASETTLIELLMDLARPGYAVVSAYAVELLAVVVQNSIRARRKVMVEVEGGMALLLKLISAFRKRDPADADHTEYLSNLFDILCSCLMTEPAVQRAFRQEEGFELMVLLIKARKLARTRAVRVLNYATLPVLAETDEKQGEKGKHGGELEATRNAVYLVKEAQGVGCVFALFMQGDQKKLAKAYKSEFSHVSDDEHITSILVNLFRALHQPSIITDMHLRDSAAECAARLVKKFTEDGHAKLIQLVSRFAWYLERVGSPEEAQGEEEYLDRLERGGFTLSQLGVLFAFVMRESSECAEYCVDALLPAAGVSLAQVRQVVSEYVGHADEEVRLELEPLVVALEELEGKKEK